MYLPRHLHPFILMHVFNSRRLPNPTFVAAPTDFSWITSSMPPTSSTQAFMLQHQVNLHASPVRRNADPPSSTQTPISYGNASVNASLKIAYTPPNSASSLNVVPTRCTLWRSRPQMTERHVWRSRTALRNSRGWRRRRRNGGESGG